MRAKLEERRGLLVPGAANALAARIIEDLGFEAVYVSGAGVTNTFLGVPDLGFVSLPEIAQHTAAIREAVEIPVLVDADTGFGNALNVRHTVRVLERAGADAIQLEDQTMPKKCGHFENKSVISAEEMAGKIQSGGGRSRQSRLSDYRPLGRAGRWKVSRRRSNARAVHRSRRGRDVCGGSANAETRSAKFRSGFPCRRSSTWWWAEKRPFLARRELADMGYGLVLYANVALQGAIAGMQAALKHLKSAGRMDAASRDGREFCGAPAAGEETVLRRAGKEILRKRNKFFKTLMQTHQVKVYPSSAQLPREEQLAWKIASVAADDVPVPPEVAEAIIDRVIDDAAVAIAAINRGPVVAAREMALGHPRPAGATVFGIASTAAIQPRVGRVGQRHGGARTGHA